MKDSPRRARPIRHFTRIFVAVAAFAFPAGLPGQVAPFYFTGFEATEGFSAGALEEADGWRAEEGTARVSAQHVFAGDSALTVLSGAPPGLVVREFNRFADTEVVYVDFFLKGAAELLPLARRIGVGDESFLLALVRERTDAGAFYAYGIDGSTDWRRVSGSSVPLDPASVMVDFARLTARLDYGRGVWDFHLGGDPVAVNLPLLTNGDKQFSRFVLRGHPERDVVIDDFYAGTSNPLFSSDDGIAISWKESLGLDPEGDTRDADPDGDSLSNVEEYFLDTHPLRADTSRDGLNDAEAVEKGLDPRLPGNRFASGLPFLDDFENWPLGDVDARGGWQVGGEGDAEVRLEAALGGNLGLHLVAEPGGVTAQVEIEGEGHPVVWTDYHVRPKPHTGATPPEIGEGSAVALYFDRKGRAVVWDGSRQAWKLVKNAPGSPNTARFAGNDSPDGWVRVTVRQNFVTQTWALWLDSRKAADNLGFATAKPFYERFAVSQLAGSGSLDQVYIGTHEPGGLDIRVTGTNGATGRSEHPGDASAQKPPFDETGPGRKDTSRDGLSDSEALALGLDPRTPSNLFAVGFPFSEDFEQRTLGDIRARGGWQVDGDGRAEVEAEAAFSGNRGLRLAADATPVSAGVETESEDRPVVWTDLLLRPSRHVRSEAPNLGAETVVGLYFDRKGNAVAWDGLEGRWLAIPLPAYAPRFVSGDGIDWTRVSIRQDFSTQTWSLWLNSVKMSEGLGFATRRSSYGRFELSGSNRTTYLDDVSVGEVEPFGLDDDGDGLTNQAEIALGTDPGNPDTSGDGMWDGDKDFWGFSLGRSGRFARIDSPLDRRGANGRKGRPGAESDAEMEWFIGADNEKSLWLSGRFRGQPGLPPDAAELDGPRTALVTVNHGGYIVGYDGLSEAWINSRQRIENEDEWVDLDLHLDYETGTWSLCINGVLRLRDLGFRDDNVRTLTRFAASSATRGRAGTVGRNAWLDGMTVLNEEPLNLDFSGDGLTNEEKRALGLDIYKVDTTGDGLPDIWLLDHGLDPLEPGIAQRDLHGYGLTVLEEFLLGTDPNLNDTDGDGWSDFDEHLAGTGALDSESFPASAGFPDWELAQVGHHPVPEAHAYRVGDEYRLAAAGSAADGDHDGFAFAYRELTGNFEITAKVRRPENLDSATAAQLRGPAQNGLMVRTSTGVAAPYNALFSGKFGYWTRLRETAGAHPLGFHHGPVAADDAVRYVRLRRTGNRFRHYFSEDGIRWDLVAENSMAMPETVLAGMFAASHSNGFRVRCRVSEIEVVQLEDEADWYLEEGDNLSPFNSFAWMGEWDGIGGHDTAALALRTPSLEELRKVGMAVSRVTELSGADARQMAGDWTRVPGGGIVCTDRRGWIEFDLDVRQPDIYLISIEGREANEFARAMSGFDFKLYLDDEYLGTRVLEASREEAGEVHAFTPWLPAGTHRLRILWDGARSHTDLQLDKVGLAQIEGPDADGNGVKDWVEARLSRQTGGTTAMGNLSFVANASPSTNQKPSTANQEQILTYVSPLHLEGVDRYHTLMQVEREVLSSPGDQHPCGTPGFDFAAHRPPLSIGSSPHPESGNQHPASNPQRFPAKSGPGYRYRADVHLAPLVDNALTIRWQNGVAEERLLARWVPYDVLEAGTISLRAGDSLLLTAGHGGEAGRSTLLVNGEPFETTPSRPLVHTFPDAGEYTVEGVYHDADGKEASGVLTVTVHDFTFPERPLANINRPRHWETGAGVGWQPAFDADSRLRLELSADDRLLRFESDENDLKTLAARLGENGPILDSVEVQGVRLFSSWETYVKVIETLPDESRLVEMMTILSPVPADAKIHLEIFVGGILFDDGTVERTLEAENFDELGRVTVRFIMPKEAKTSVCHRTYLYQNDELIGVR